MNFKNSQIVDILSNRTKNYLGKYFQAIPKKERDNVKHISIDVWEPYKDIAITYLNKAIISVDPFHVIEHINTALKKVRVRTMKKYELTLYCSENDETAIRVYLEKNFTINSLAIKNAATNENQLKIKASIEQRKRGKINLLCDDIKKICNVDSISILEVNE